MSGRCRVGAASLLWGLIGPSALGLGGSMSLCGTPAACAAGPASGGGGGGGGGFSSARLSPPWLRLPEVVGAEPQRANDLLLLLPPAPRGPAPPQHHVVYFPGDVQVRGGVRGRQRGARGRNPAAEGAGPARRVELGSARLRGSVCK